MRYFLFRKANESMTLVQFAPMDQFVPLENFPGILKTVPCILGIDEAGRGPVLGPLVYSIFICPIESQAVLKQLGVAGNVDNVKMYLY